MRTRKPDQDLVAYLENNDEIFKLDDIKNIHAEVVGHNDEDYWYWIIELKDGRFLLTSAWCDYTGWDCQSGGHSEVTKTTLAAAKLASEKEVYTHRDIRKNLIAQLKGTLPFGVYQS